MQSRGIALRASAALLLLHHSFCGREVLRAGFAAAQDDNRISRNHAKPRRGSHFWTVLPEVGFLQEVT
jgi:hypothetical protein